MDSLKKALAQVAAQMRDMTLSQRMALVLGALLVAGSVVWLAQWAATSEMTPLLPQDLSAEELAAVRNGLEGMGEPYEIEGSRVLVRAGADRQAILAQLQQAEQLPTDTSTGFAALVAESNPWISQDEQGRRWTVALQSELEGTLRSLAGVKQARVFLNVSSRRTLVARHELPSSASVTLEMKGGDRVPRSVALTAARMVAGAVSGLSSDNVQVLDATGRVALDPAGEVEGSASQLYREQLQREQRIAEKIRSILPDPQARVSVRVELNATQRRKTSNTPTDPVPVEEDKMISKQTRGTPSGQPGVQPNTGVVAGGGKLAEHSEQETSTKRYTTGTTLEEESTPSGDVEEIFAAVRLSDAYLAAVHKRMTGTEEEPTAEQLEAAFKQREPRIRKQVMMLVKGTGENVADENIAVDWYFAVPDHTVVAAAGPMGDVGGLATRYGPQAGLGLLALLSLGMMLRMARKTSGGEALGLEIGLPADAIEAARQAAEDVDGVAQEAAARRQRKGSASASEYDDAPQAASAEGVLMAQEVDEHTVQMNKMVEQVAGFIDKDAETVANLFERWVESDE